MTFHYLIHESPLGKIMLVSNKTAITGIHIVHGKYVPAVQSDWVHARNHSVLKQAQQELDAYFAGKLQTFAVPLAPHGTVFQKSVWTALTTIPYGETRTYGQQALAIGQPAAARAVGAANGRNPIGIIVPCHRVIGASGAMTGYAGGLDAKKFLLDLEASFGSVHRIWLPPFQKVGFGIRGPRKQAHLA